MLEQRKQLLRETCDSDEEAFHKDKRGLEDELRRFIVDDYHGIIYCYIPKVILQHSWFYLYLFSLIIPFCSVYFSFRAKKTVTLILITGGEYQLEEDYVCPETEPQRALQRPHVRIA